MSTVLVDLGGIAAAASAHAAAPVQNPQPAPGQGEEFGKASPVALVVIVLLGLATVLLVRSMSKRIRRLPASFEPTDVPPDEPGPVAPTDRDADDAGGGRA